MRDLVSLCNVYIETQRKTGSRPNSLLLKNIAVYITRMLRVNFQFLYTFWFVGFCQCFDVVVWVTGRNLACVFLM